LGVVADFDAQDGRALETDLSAAQREADNLDLHDGLIGVAGLVAGARSVDDLIGDVASFAARAIPGTDGASVALLQPQGTIPRVQTCAATAEFVSIIDDAQYCQFAEGPCVTTMESGRAMSSGSLGSDRRWPRFGGKVARMGVHSALSLPLSVGDEIVGTINAYARARDAFGDHAVDLGTQFAVSAAVSVYNAQLLARARKRTEQLQRALASRTVIDQAIGIVRSRTGTDAEEAFCRLVRLSQDRNVKLSVVAEELVDEAVRRARARSTR
jgi:GAF domain-containing protein